MAIALAANDRTAVQATIRRATYAAHRQVERLDAQTLKELGALYKRAAADIAERIGSHAGPDGNLALQELQNVLAQVTSRLRELAQARDALMTQGLETAADLGVRPFKPQGGAAVLDMSAAMRVSDEALNFVRTFVAADGLQLSDRIWRLDRGARDQVVNAIEMAVIQGQGASQAAREFLARGKTVPIEVQGKIDAANAAKIGKQVTGQLFTGVGSPMDNAMRLFRTEINRAHGEAYMMGGENAPGFVGWRFLLSPAHPQPDICDLLSRQNLYGLGPGVYPSREKCPWPAHPNTLSFVEIVFKDEITEADRSGKETPIEALKRLTPEQQRGVLGQDKKAILDAGKLTRGMIRTPLSLVRTRIGIPLEPPIPPPAVPSTKHPPRKALDDFVRLGAEKVDELIAQAQAAEGGIGANFGEILHRDLNQVRPTETQAKVRNEGAGADLVRAASRMFPDDWTRRADRFGPLEARYREGRAYYRGMSDGSGQIEARNFASAVHEYTHRLQHALPRLDDFFQDLHHLRTAGDPLKTLRRLLPGRGYGTDEVTREDKYVHPYQGREYSHPSLPYQGKHGALEVMTMAFEDVLANDARRLADLLSKDREMFNLVIGLLYHYVP